MSKNENSFLVEHTVYFNETNAVGGVVYFSNFVKWQGMVREKYFIDTVPEWRDIMKYIQAGKLNMITVEEHSFFSHHAFFGDKIIIKLQTTNIKKYSFDMIYTMINAETEKLVYEGFQRLTFDDFSGKFIEIPPPMLASVRKYQMTSEFSETSKLRKFFSLQKA